MNESALLPPGFQDALSDKARTKSAVTTQFGALFEAMGYDPVDPPLMEFEQSLFTGAGAALENQTFRVLDPLSQKMVGIRADITVQIARLATSRLNNTEEPIRLSYAGDVMRVQGQGLDAKRQLTQAGIELIGTDNAEADSEILATSIQALYDIGIKEVSIDFTVPRLVSKLVEEAKLDDDTAEKLNYALEKKDIAAIRALGGSIGKTLVTLATATSIDTISPLIDTLPSEEYRLICNRLKTITKQIKELFPELIITTDFIEYKGYEYHSGVCFSLFSTEHNLEVGRGGRYIIPTINTPAVGCSLYVDALVRILPPPPAKEKIYIPYGVSITETQKLRDEGYSTIHATDNTAPEEQARALECNYIYNEKKITKL